MKKILVIAAHPDDEIIGCGGTLIKHKKNGDVVQVVFTSDGDFSRNIKNPKGFREESAIKVAKKLKFKEPIFLNFPGLNFSRANITKLGKEVTKIISKYNPDIIYTHSFFDVHHDHRATFEATMIATRPGNKKKIKRIYSFEINSGTDSSFGLNGSYFNPNFFIDIKKEISKKLQILKIYDKEILKFPNSRSYEGIKNSAIFRGNMVSLNYCEAFQFIRGVNY